MTGANDGLGFAIAAAPAQHGADVVLACRNGDKAAAAADQVRIAAPGSSVRTLPLDLASLAAVRASARQLHDEYDHIDLSRTYGPTPTPTPTPSPNQRQSVRAPAS